MVSLLLPPPALPGQGRSLLQRGGGGRGLHGAATEGLWPRTEGPGTTPPRPAQLLSLLLIHFMIPILILNFGYNNFMVWDFFLSLEPRQEMQSRLDG